MEKIDNITEKGRDLLEKGFDQQQILTELVDDIHAANDSVVKTIDEWTEKLQETERIYEDLKNSDSDTQKLRKNAEDALKTIPEIEAIINEALKEAADEQTVLEAISETATAALNTAEDAQDETERVSIGLQDLLAEAQALNKDADDLNKTDSEITQRVKESEDNLDDLLRYPLSTIKL
ncbi:laminin subunit gamma-1-like, partial [Dendroctonus ponderosae]|uniref:laminin subunit gamma-1-like n=1 Tax=Dendroctonus ponderosae TaxID=77166 RepID=UPI00203569D8